jgi:hypothetical protein
MLMSLILVTSVHDRLTGCTGLINGLILEEAKIDGYCGSGNRQGGLKQIPEKGL